MVMMEKSDRKSKKKHKRKVEELRPMTSYVGDRPALLAQLFSALPKDKMLAMLPPVLRDVPQDELRADCLEALLGLSARRVRSVLRGEQLGSSSSSDTDSQSEASREPSPNRQLSPSPAPANQNRSLLEIVELQLRARAIRAALSHGEAEEPTLPPVRKPPTPTAVAVMTASESEPEISAKPIEVRAKKRPVLVGPLKRLGKRVLLTTYQDVSSAQPIEKLAAPLDERREGEIIVTKSKVGDVKVEEKCKTEIEGPQEEEVRVSEEKVFQQLAKEEENEIQVLQATTNAPDSLPVESGFPVADKVMLEAPCEVVQDATWIDRRLQQTASPALRSRLIGSTRQRLANHDTETIPQANENQVEISPMANGREADADEGSVSQYASLACNALDPEPLELNYDED